MEYDEVLGRWVGNENDESVIGFQKVLQSEEPAEALCDNYGVFCVCVFEFCVPRFPTASLRHKDVFPLFKRIHTTLIGRYMCG